MRIDSEMVIDRITAIFQASLNTKIDAINTEKGDSVVLGQVPSAAYAFQSLDDSVQNYNPFMLIGIDNIESAGLGANTSEILFITAVIILADNGQDMAITRRLLRYNRALRETIQSNWSDARIPSRMEISSLVPVQFKLANSSKLYRAVGIQIKVGLS